MTIMVYSWHIPKFVRVVDVLFGLNCIEKITGICLKLGACFLSTITRHVP